MNPMRWLASEGQKKIWLNWARLKKIIYVDRKRLNTKTKRKKRDKTKGDRDKDTKRKERQGRKEHKGRH